MSGSRHDRMVNRVPRTRGDEPHYERGDWLAALVFPAPAGMNRLMAPMACTANGVPRTRGDEPQSPIEVWRAWKCSPHPRG